MITTEVYERAVEIAKGILDGYKLESFKRDLSKLICDIRVGDMVRTPRGVFRVVAVMDNGSNMDNNFIETLSDRAGCFNMFRVDECSIV